MAAILLQPNGTDTDTERHPRLVVFWSKKFNATKSRYKVHNKELMAIVFALQHWRYYIEGAAYTVRVITDYKNLGYFMSTKKLLLR